jgi:hypothetical protein
MFVRSPGRCGRPCCRVCSSFYEGSVGADDPVARRRPVGAPGPTNWLTTGTERPFASAPLSMAPGGVSALVDGARGGGGSGGAESGGGVVGSPAPDSLHRHHPRRRGLGPGGAVGVRRCGVAAAG